MYLTKQKGYGRGKNRYQLWKRRPTKSLFAGPRTVHWLGEDAENTIIFCPQLIERHTNVYLKPGEIREVKSITFEFEEINHA